MKNIYKIVMLAVTLALVVQIPVNADPANNENQTEQRQLEQDKNALKEAEDKRQELELSIEKLDNQIEDFMMKIEENKKEITQTENEINISKKEIVKVEEEVSIQQDIQDQRLRAIYKSGQSDYLNILFSSESLSDLISKAGTIVTMLNIDKKVISDLELIKTEVENKKAAIEDKYSELRGLKNGNEEKLASLNISIADQKKLIKDAKSQEQIFASKVSESQKLVNKTLTEVNKIRSEAPKYQPSRGQTSVSDSNIIAFASNFLGTPYLWGGTSPATGFDCSGFTQYVYAHFGIGIGRTTYDQINDGYAVSKNELQAGDLVFFGQDNNPTHMGIYVANNTYIHSPRTGDVIKISSMDRTDYITGRRVK